MATEADLIQKFKDLNIPVGADFEELIHEAFAGANLVAEVENNLATKADDSKVVHKTGDEEISGSKTFDVAPIDKTTGNPYITKEGVPNIPSDVARTGKANTFSLPQTFSQGVKTLQTGSYSDANSLVNEGLYYNTNSSIKNGAGSLTTGYIQVMSGYGGFIRQIMYSDADAGLIYDRISQDGGSSWSDWIRMITWDAVPSELAFTNRDANFTGKLQKSGIDVATTMDVSTAVSGATSQVAHLVGTNNFTGSIQHNGNPVGAHIQASKNDENSAISDSTKGNPDDIYYWTQG